MQENKIEIVQELHRLLMNTRAGAEIIDMYYTEEDFSETVVIKYMSGAKKYINVTADSGIALIRDVVKEIH